MSRSQVFCFVFLFKCLNATIPLTCTLANEYLSSNEISKKNGTVRGNCIACNALFSLKIDTILKKGLLSSKKVIEIVSFRKNGEQRRCTHTLLMSK